MKEPPSGLSSSDLDAVSGGRGTTTEYPPAKSTPGDAGVDFMAIARMLEQQEEFGA